MTALETGLTITSVVLFTTAWHLGWGIFAFYERAEKASKEIEYLKKLNAKFIRLNNRLLDEKDKLIDKRKFNGTKHKQR